MDLDLNEYLRTRPIVALVGASRSPAKFGNIIFQDLRRKGFRVLPINPFAEKIEDEPVYPDLIAAREKEEIGLVVYVTPPEATLQSLHKALALNLKKVWVQPGAGDEAVRSFLNENDFEYLMDACVMLRV